MYVAVKGGETAIKNAHKLLDKTRRGDLQVPELSVKQIHEQLPLAVARVMTEGSIYDPELAALAIKQSAGDLVEAIFLLRAYRTTLSRFYRSEPIETTQMNVERRISATFKDLPGGKGRRFQQVGRTSAGFKGGVSFAGRASLIRAGTGRRQLKRRLSLRRRRGKSVNPARKDVKL